MATTTAASGVLKAGASGSEAQILEITSYSLDYNSDTTEDTVIGDTARTYKATLKSFTATVDCIWDPAAGSNQDEFSMGSTVSFQIYPEGDSSSDTYYYGSAIVTGRSLTTSVGEMVTASFSLQGTGDLTTGTVA